MIVVVMMVSGLRMICRRAVLAPHTSGIITDDGEEDLLESRLLLDVFDLGGWEQPLELGEGAVHDDPTLVEDRDLVGELFGLVEILRGEQHCGAVLSEFPDGLPHLNARLGVEPSRRLVEEDDLRISDEAHRDVEPTAHATRIGRHLTRGRVGQRQALEQGIRDHGWVLEVSQPGDKHEVLPPAEDFVDGRELSGEADGFPDIRSLGSDIEAVDAGSSCVGLEQRGQDVHDRGLARPVRAEQRENAAPRHVEVDVPQDVEVFVRLLQAPYADGGRGHRRRCHSSLPSSASAFAMALISRSRSLLIHWPCV
jgi:hypothetical protein